MSPKQPVHEYVPLDNEKLDVDSGSDRTSAEEDDSFIHKAGLAFRPRPKGLRRWLQDPWVTFISGGFLFSMLLILGIATLAIIQNQHVGQNDQSHHHMKHPSASPAPAEIRNEKGLLMTADGKLLECGKTTKEAEANNCTFDAFSFSYVPPACFEQDLMEEALDPESYLAPYAAGVFPWYRWSNFTDEVPQRAEDLKQYKSLWTNNRWHKAHCLYEWRLAVRALHRQSKGVKPVYVLKGAVEVFHANHCSQLVSEPLHHDESPIWVMRTISECLRVDNVVDEFDEPAYNY